MKLLLDTHVFLWMHGDPDRLSARARKLLVDADTELHLSVVVAWELGIKLARERLTLPEPLDDYVMSRAQRARMSLLSIDLVHVLEAVALPSHHADPFDRMLVAQARAELDPVDRGPVDRALRRRNRARLTEASATG